MKAAVYIIATALSGPMVSPAGAQFSQLGPPVRLSQPNPLAACDDGFNIPGTLTLDDANEPFVASNPVHPNNVVAAWVLGPFQNVVASVSFNGGNTWQQIPMPLTVCSGGSFLAAGDPRLAFAPNGDLYGVAITGNTLSTRSISVTKSLDGGLHWSAPISMTGNTFSPDDIPAITPDPVDARLVYLIWDGSDNGHRVNAVFSRTTDGGNTWEPARPIVQSSPQNFVQFSQIFVLPNGTLVDLYETYYEGPKQAIKRTSLQTVRSIDHGLTWSPPTNVVTMTPLYQVTGPNQGNTLVVDPETGQAVDDPTNPSFAADGRNGNLYAVWEDGRFSNFQYNDIAFSMSADGGFTWSAPIRVNQTPLGIPTLNRQAFLPTVAVAANGTIGVSYYDFRFNDANPGVPTDYWLVQCNPSSTTAPMNPANWGNELRLTPISFNLEACPIRVSGFILGDYLGLTASGNGFISTFTQPDPINGISSIFARQIGP